MIHGGERHKCKICNKKFGNGRALGGHMKSHLAKLPIPPKTHHQQQLEPIKHLSSSSQPSTPSDLSDSLLHDRTSEADSSRTPGDNQHNSLRLPERRAYYYRSYESISPVSGASRDEDVAFCLMMLSRDSWTTPSPSTREKEAEEEIEKPKARSGYRCGTCRKQFRSYQALGGHRASHKKIKIQNHDDDDDDDDDHEEEEEEEQQSRVSSKTNGTVEQKQQRAFECPYCFKVFDSGQALGGHKKVHPISTRPTTTSVNAASSSARTTKPNKLIDLNLPPLDDDDDDRDFPELSTVSDAAMHHHHHHHHHASVSRR